MKKHNQNYSGASCNIEIIENGYILTQHGVYKSTKAFSSFEELVFELAKNFGLINISDKLFIETYKKDGTKNLEY